jgi:hypothetical protein
MRADGQRLSRNVALRLFAVAVLGILYTIIRLGGVHAGAATVSVRRVTASTSPSSARPGTTRSTARPATT